MITFKNPQEKIYDLENLDNKIILVHTSIPDNKNSYYGIVQKQAPNEYVIKGGIIDIGTDDICIWGINGKTVLDMLTRYYTDSIGSRYEYTFYIIEKMSELRDVLI